MGDHISKKGIQLVTRQFTYLTISDLFIAIGSYA